MRAVALAALVIGIGAQGATPLVLRVHNEVVAPNGWVQIKVYADNPVTIANGSLELDLGSAFGPVEGFATFSPAGDAVALATVSGGHIVASISSPSGGIGRMPGVPVFSVRAQVLMSSGQANVALSLPQAPVLGLLEFSDPSYPVGAWADPQGNAYSPLLVSGQVTTLTGALAIHGATPSGGFLSAGAVVHINGAGFTPSTTVTADGGVVSAFSYVSATQMDVTLGASVELTGVHFQVSQGAYSSDFFPSLDTAPSAAPTSFNGFQAQPPMSEWTSVNRTVGAGGGWMILSNPSSATLSLTEQLVTVGAPPSSTTVTIPAGAMRVEPMLGPQTLTITSSTPFRAVVVAVTSTGTYLLPPDLGQTPPPVLGGIVNAASGLRAALAPGELATVFGTGLGTATLGAAFDNTGKIATSAGGNQVLIGGAPAPVLYASPTQWNVQVPYEVDGAKTATVQVVVAGVSTKTWTLPVATTSPGIFTTGPSSIGFQAAALNQDGSVNSSANSAARGSIVSIFLTGEGQTAPAGVTGGVSPNPAPLPKLPVTVALLDAPATVTYAGEAPTLISGVLQVNFFVPNVPLIGDDRFSVSIGSATIPTTGLVTIAVK